MANILQEAVAHQAMSSLVIRIRHSTVSNQYDIFYKTQVGARFPSNSLLSKVEFFHGKTMTPDIFKSLTSSAAAVEPGTMLGPMGSNVGMG
jgi:hypothetical protein